MEDWDQAQLEAAIAQKEKANLNRPTEIICKFFLDARPQPPAQSRPGPPRHAASRACPDGPLATGPAGHREEALRLVLGLPQWRAGV